MLKISKILIILFFPGFSFAQSWEVGLFAGASNYQGDLAPDLVLSESHAALGLSLKQNISPYFAFTYNLNYGAISGNDNNFKPLAPRNLSFESNILEFSPQVEFNFFNFHLGLRPKKFTPYVFTGLSVFYFDPKTTYDGKKYSLRKMSTEGQGAIDGAPKRYNQLQLAIPIGGGLRFMLNENWHLYVHGSYRATFTDYLDDVSGTYVNLGLLSEKAGPIPAKLSDRSGEINGGNYLSFPGKQRGNPTNKDWYIFTGITISYVIKDPSCYSFKR
jgi:hypothetical protein